MLYSRRSFIWESKYQKHPNNRIVLKGFFIVIHFWNHATAITGERFATFVSNERFPNTYTLFKFISYHTLHPVLCTIPYVLKHLFLIIVLFLELRYLNSKNVVNPEQVRFQTFRVNYLLLYIENCHHEWIVNCFHYNTVPVTTYALRKILTS
jgi:hypothetical protein